ncbi:MAG: type II/IV secretion system protein [Bacillaceae bacterium]|nr:type II/IV secretion system protein [Bacillaceae bacterium]
MFYLKQTKTFSYSILYQAIAQSASDIHFCPYEDSVQVYFRIHGKRLFQFSISFDDYQPLLSRLKFTSGMDIGENRKPQDGNLSLQKDRSMYDLRLSTLPVHQSESLAIRILPRDLMPPLNQLFLFPRQAEKLKRLICKKSGLILFTGPTGSGKTTTLYSLIQWLTTGKEYQTITLEDPIEKKVTDVLQVQVNEKAGVTYDTGLKAALRHDPDILMVGEIRDRNTAKFAFHAAYTGHLVLSTIHSKNAYSTIFRLKEMGISETDIRQMLIGVASQELLPIVPPFLSGQSGRRAAILEILDGYLLEQAVYAQSFSKSATFESFQDLRRKAYALGFIEKQTYLAFNSQTF